MIEAVNGIGGIQSRTPTDDQDFTNPKRGESQSGQGARSIDGTGLSADDSQGRSAITPFVVDVAIKSVDALISGAPRIVAPGFFGRVTEVYEDAIKAIAGTRPMDLVGQGLDRIL